MNQRGSIGIYLSFSIVISIAAGYGMYRVIHDHKSAFESKNDDAPTTKQAAAPAPTPAAVAAPPIDEAEAPVPEPAIDPMSEAMTLAEARVVEPAVDSDSGESPLLGTPGISGGIERGSVERRFRSRAPLLQRCFERSGGEPGKLHVSMEIEPGGTISHIALSAGWDDGFQACVISALNFSFSATKDGNPAAVVQPIAFR